MNTRNYAQAQQARSPYPASQGAAGDNRLGWLEYFMGDAFYKRTTDFSGTTSRQTFWGNWLWLLLFAGAAFGLTMLLTRNVFIFGPGLWGLPLILLVLATCIPAMAIRARRLRDGGWSPMLLAFYLVPLITLALFLYIWFSESYWEVSAPWIGGLALLNFAGVFGALYAMAGHDTCPETRCKPVDIIVIVLCLLLWLTGLVKLYRDLMHVRWIDEHVTWVEERGVYVRPTFDWTDPVVVRDVVEPYVVHRHHEDLPVDTIYEQEADELVDEANRVGKNGDLKVTLLWDFPADIDLHVKQPNGREIYYGHRQDSDTGGELDVDNRAGCQGAAENIYWTNPQSGQYQIGLDYFSPSTRNGEEGAGTCRVVVQRKGKAPQTYNVPMTHEGDKRLVGTIDVP